MIDSPPALLPGIEFSGEQADLWNNFTREYTQQGTSTYNVKTANYLNQLAFGGGVEKFVTQYSLDKNPSALQDCKERIEDIGKAISGLVEDKPMLPLNRTIAEKLITQWIELEKKHGLDPTAPAPATNGVSLAEKRRRLRNSPEGALISGALRMLENSTITTHTHRVFHDAEVRRQYRGVKKKRIEYDDVLFEAELLFNTSLWTYQNSYDAAFNTWVGNGLLNYLHRHVLNHVDDETISMDAVKNEEQKPLTETLADKREASPVDRAIQDDLRDKIRYVVSKLQPEFQEILNLRFGLIDEITRTLEEVATELDVSKPRIRQIEAAAIRSLMANYKGQYGESLDAFYEDERQRRSPPPSPPAKERPHSAQRALNPKGKHTCHSFGELLNVALDKGLPFDRFIDDLLTERWKITPQEFHDCIIRNIDNRLQKAQQEEGFNQDDLPDAVRQYITKKTNADPLLPCFPEAEIIQKWAEGRYPPRKNRPDITLMAYAFGLSPSQEHMLWKLIHGKTLNLMQVQEAIDKKHNGELGALLVDASGITHSRLGELLGVQAQTVNGWVNTGHPHYMSHLNLEVAEQFANLLTQQLQYGDQSPAPEQIATMRRRVMEIMTNHKLEHLPRSSEDATTQFKALMEEALEKGHTFNEFITHVIKKWDVPASYLNFINVNNAESQTDYQPIDRQTFWNWESKAERPWWPTMEKIVTGTGMNVAQELKLWKLAYGKRVTADEVKAAVAKGQSGELLRLLLDGAGIGEKRLIHLMAIPDDMRNSDRYIPERSQHGTKESFWEWTHEKKPDGASAEEHKPRKIQDLKKAERLAALLIANIEWPEKNASQWYEAEELQTQVVEQLTGRDLAQPLLELVISAMDEDEKDNVKSHGKLCKLLSRRIGMDRTAQAKALGMTVAVFDDVKSGATILSENQAKKLIKLAGGSTKDSVCQAVNVITKTLSPSEMLAAAEAGKVQACDVLEETRKRRKHSQEDVETITGISKSTIQRFEEKGTKSEHATACTLADYIGFEDEERRKFVVLARGRDLMPVTKIVHQLAKNQISKCDAVHMLCNQTAEDEEVLAKLLGYRNRKHLRDYVTGKAKEVDLSEKSLATLLEWGGLEPQPSGMQEIYTAFGIGAGGILHMVEQGAMDRTKGMHKLLEASDITESDLRDTYHIPLKLVKSIPKLLQDPGVTNILAVIAERTGMDATMTEKLQAMYDPQRAYADDGFVAQLERREGERKDVIGQIIGGVIDFKTRQL